QQTLSNPFGKPAPVLWTTAERWRKHLRNAVNGPQTCRAVSRFDLLPTVDGAIVVPFRRSRGTSQNRRQFPHSVARCAQQRHGHDNCVALLAICSRRPRPQRVSSGNARGYLRASVVFFRVEDEEWWMVSTLTVDVNAKMLISLRFERFSRP